ncbi:MAG TPA: hypothetical protein DCQ31_03625, partial [Bacteroidales bacterium]|nr:hypothetical protein [Bacteroidales bacterium]
MKTTSFKFRIIIWSGLVFTFSIAVIISYNAVSRLQAETEYAIKDSELLTDHLTNAITHKIDYSLDVLNALNISIKTSKNKLDRSTVNNILGETLKANAEFLGTYTLWEPNAFDKLDRQFTNKPGHDQTGRFIPYWTRKSDTELLLEPLMSYEIVGDGDYYQKPKQTKVDCIIDPYWYEIAGKKTLLMSAVSPIIIEGNFNGIVGVDFGIDFIQKEAQILKGEVFNGLSEIEIISNSGLLVASTIAPDSLGKSIVELERADAEAQIKKIQKGKSETKIENDKLIITKSFIFGNTTTPWQIRFIVPTSEITKNSRAVVINSVLVGLALLTIGLLFIYLLISYLMKPLYQLIVQTKKLAQGDISSQIVIKRNDEIGQLAMVYSTMITKLNEIVGSIRKSTVNIVSGTTQLSAASQVMA